MACVIRYALSLPGFGAPASVDTRLFSRKVRAPMNYRLQDKLVICARHQLPARMSVFVRMAKDDLPAQTS